MKNNYQEIIDKFGEGRIGNVLEELNKTYLVFGTHVTSVIIFWRNCGFTKSLSEILSDEMLEYCGNCETFNVFDENDYGKKYECTKCKLDPSRKKFKLSPKATELFQLLKTL